MLVLVLEAFLTVTVLVDLMFVALTVTVLVDFVAFTVTVVVLTKEVELTGRVTGVLLFGASIGGEAETGTDWAAAERRDLVAPAA